MFRFAQYRKVFRITTLAKQFVSFAPAFGALRFPARRRRGTQSRSSFGTADVPRTSGEKLYRGAENRTRATRSQSAHTAIMLRPDAFFRPREYVSRYATPRFCLTAAMLAYFDWLLNAIWMLANCRDFCFLLLYLKLYGRV